MTISILPILSISDKITKDISEAVGNTFLSRTALEDPVKELPKDTYDTGREQYDSERLISHLNELTKDLESEKILFVGNMDLFIGDMNYIFGIAQKGGRIGGISLYRLDQRFYEKEADYEKLKDRTIKEAIHELAHCFGLSHCSNKGCVMQFSNDVMAVDQKAANFCGDCREQLRHSLCV